MANIGRCVIKSSGSFGGWRGVFYVPDHKNNIEVVDGGMLSSEGLTAGDKIYAGDFGNFDYKTGMVTHLKAWRVKTAAGAADTKLILEGGEFNHLMKGDVILAKAPKVAAGTTVADVVTGVAITKDKIAVVGDTIEVTITANAFGALAVGDVIVLAKAAGASKEVIVKAVNWIFGHDVEIAYTVTDDYTENVGSASFTVSGYYSASIYQSQVENRSAKVIPPYVMALNKLTNNTHVFKL